MKVLKHHSQEKLFELANDKWYVKHTNEEVIIRAVEARHQIDRPDIQYIVEIEFVNQEPSVIALQMCSARQQRQIWVGPYSGHPSPDIHIWEARVDLNNLTKVPYGTPAAEVLFAEKNK